MIGDVILAVMRAQGLTQTDLAEAVEMRQATISRYISGDRIPDEAEVKKLAEALGVTPAFLTHEFRMSAAIGVQAHMRRQKSTRVMVWKQAEAKLNELRMHLAYLTDRAPLTAQEHVPTFDADFTSPDTAARDVRTAWRVPMGPIRSLTNLFEAAGIVIVESDLQTPRIDGLSQWVSEFPLIILNSHLAASRRRLTLAHELGHIVLHAGGYVGDDIEEQANQFAAEFLMPEAEVRHQLRNVSTGKLFDLKREWGVSVQALFERAYRLGYKTKAERAEFYKRLNVNGWRTAEPEEESVPTERPCLAASLRQQFLDAGLGEGDFARFAGYAPAWVPPELKPARVLQAV